MANKNKKLYQKVNVKPKRAGNTNTNSINIIIHPDEMYKHKETPRPSTSIMNALSQPVSTDDSMVKQVLDRANRSDEGNQLKQQDVEAAFQQQQLGDMGNRIGEILEDEEAMKELQDQQIQTEDNVNGLIQMMKGREDGAPASDVSTFTREQLAAKDEIDRQLQQQTQNQLQLATNRIQQLEERESELFNDVTELEDEFNRLQSDYRQGLDYNTLRQLQGDIMSNLSEPRDEWFSPDTSTNLRSPSQFSSPSISSPQFEIRAGPLLARLPEGRDLNSRRPLSFNTQFAQGTDVMEYKQRIPRRPPRN